MGLFNVISSARSPVYLPVYNFPNKNGIYQHLRGFCTNHNINPKCITLEPNSMAISIDIHAPLKQKLTLFPVNHNMLWEKEHESEGLFDALSASFEHDTLVSQKYYETELHEFLSINGFSQAYSVSRKCDKYIVVYYENRAPLKVVCSRHSCNGYFKMDNDLIKNVQKFMGYETYKR